MRIAGEQRHVNYRTRAQNRAPFTTSSARGVPKCAHYAVIKQPHCLKCFPLQRRRDSRSLRNGCLCISRKAGRNGGLGYLRAKDYAESSVSGYVTR